MSEFSWKESIEGHNLAKAVQEELTLNESKSLLRFCNFQIEPAGLMMNEREIKVGKLGEVGKDVRVQVAFAAASIRNPIVTYEMRPSIVTRTVLAGTVLKMPWFTIRLGFDPKAPIKRLACQAANNITVTVENLYKAGYKALPGSSVTIVRYGDIRVVDRLAAPATEWSALSEALIEIDYGLILVQSDVVWTAGMSFYHPGFTP